MFRYGATRASCQLVFVTGVRRQVSANGYGHETGPPPAGYQAVKPAEHLHASSWLCAPHEACERMEHARTKGLPVCLGFLKIPPELMDIHVPVPCVDMVVVCRHENMSRAIRMNGHSPWRVFRHGDEIVSLKIGLMIGPAKRSDDILSGYGSQSGREAACRKEGLEHDGVERGSHAGREEQQ